METDDRPTPVLYKLASNLTAAFGQNRRAMVKLFNEHGLLCAFGGKYRQVLGIADAMVRAAGGVYRITSPWGRGEIEPLPIDPESIFKAQRHRLLSNRSSISDAAKIGRYSKDHFKGKDFDETVDDKAESSMMNSTAKALSAFACALPAGRIEPVSLTACFKDLLLTVHASSSPPLLVTSIPLVTGINQMAINTLWYHNPDEVRELGEQPEEIDDGRASHQPCVEVLDYLNGTMWTLQAFGVGIEIHFGYRHYVFPARPEKKLVKGLQDSLGAEPTEPKLVPPHQITNPMHRKLVELYLAKAQAPHDHVGVSHTHARNIIQSYGYNRASRMQISNDPDLGSLRVTQAAHRFIKDLPTWLTAP
jgi:hypothetical protein